MGEKSLEKVQEKLACSFGDPTWRGARLTNCENDKSGGGIKAIETKSYWGLE